MEDIVEPIAAAVSDFNGVAPMKALARHSESASMQDFTRHYPELRHSEVKLVPVLTLDRFVEERKITAPLFVKIDAEGEDCHVVEGMQRTLAASQIIGAMVEITGKYMTEAEFLKLASSFADFTMVNMRALDLAGTHGFYEIVKPNDLPGLYQKTAAPPGWAVGMRLRQHTSFSHCERTRTTPPAVWEYGSDCKQSD
jgi:FkbM family methyltransferase